MLIRMDVYHTSGCSWTPNKMYRADFLPSCTEWFLPSRPAPGRQPVTAATFDLELGESTLGGVVKEIWPEPCACVCFTSSIDSRRWGNRVRKRNVQILDGYQGV